MTWPFLIVVLPCGVETSASPLRTMSWVSEAESHLDAIAALAERAHRHVGRVDFHVGLAAFENREVDESLRHLHLDPRARQICNLHFGVGGEAKDVSVVELDFGLRAVAGGDLVALHDRGVHRGRHPIAGVAAHGGDVTMD